AWPDHQYLQVGPERWKRFRRNVVGKDRYLLEQFGGRTCSHDESFQNVQQPATSARVRIRTGISCANLNLVHGGLDSIPSGFAGQSPAGKDRSKHIGWSPARAGAWQFFRAVSAFRSVKM